jgi:hypothetical protein
MPEQDKTYSEPEYAKANKSHPFYAPSIDRYLTPEVISSVAGTGTQLVTFYTVSEVSLGVQQHSPGPAIKTCT